jgi:hypothetical protein
LEGKIALIRNPQEDGGQHKLGGFPILIENNLLPTSIDAKALYQIERVKTDKMDLSPLGLLMSERGDVAKIIEKMERRR